jgi:hypothetical protein
MSGIGRRQIHAPSYVDNGREQPDDKRPPEQPAFVFHVEAGNVQLIPEEPDDEEPEPQEERPVVPEPQEAPEDITSNHSDEPEERPELHRSLPRSEAHLREELDDLARDIAESLVYHPERRLNFGEETDTQIRNMSQNMGLSEVEIFAIINIDRVREIPLDYITRILSSQEDQEEDQQGEE